MAYCPSCKIEVKDDMYVCPECGNHTYFEKDGSEYTLLANGNIKEEQAERLVEYFHYSSIPEAYCEKNDVMEIFQFFVSPEHVKEGLKIYRTFRKAEEEQEKAEQKEDGEEKEKEAPKTAVYVDKKSKYEDFHSSGITLIVVGILAALFTILNYVGVLSFFSGWLPLVVLLGLSAGFVIAGISSLKRAGELRYEAREEKKSRQTVNEWLEEHVTLDMLKQLESDEKQPEVIAMEQIDFITKKLNEQFETSAEFLDELAEEYYNQLMQP